MNNLFSHIEYLLLSHDCVIMPGLGAFIAIVRPATIDYDKGLITPPSRRVMFNQAISSDDGLLANSLARKFNLSFEEARQIVAREASLIKKNLASSKEIAAGRLGTLRMGDEGNLMFTPTLRTDIVASQLGFSSLNITKQTNLTTQADTKQSDTNPEPRRYHFRISKTLPKVAAAFMIVAAVTVAIILNPIPTDNREQRASVVPVEAIITSKPTIAKPTSNESLAESERKKTVSEATVAIHYLIVATFSSSKEAATYIAENSTDECRMEAVESKRMTRVAIASSCDKEQLRKRLNSKEILSKYPNAWIWSRQ